MLQPDLNHNNLYAVGRTDRRRDPDLPPAIDCDAIHRGHVFGRLNDHDDDVAS